MLQKMMGMDVIEAVDGEQAVAVWEREAASIHVILMDMHMPRMNGLEATARIRAREAALGLPRVPIIACTASVLPEERSEASQSGVDGHLGKPLSVKELSQAISERLQERRA
jgi:CheY-like chemotaxis protein